MTQQAYKSPTSSVQTNPQLQRNNGNGFLWKGMLIGATIGGLAALIDKSTRKNIQNRSVRIKDQTSNVFRTVKDDPTLVMNTVRSSMDKTSKALNELASEVRDVIRKVDDVRAHSKETYSSFKEVGQELRDVSGTVVEASKELSDINSNKTNTIETSTTNKQS